MDLSVVPYEEKDGDSAAAKYLECMRNHAAAIGGQAYDGCGEFMPGGEDGSIEALKCAACGCHRNFHRREGSPAAGAGFPPRRPLLLAPPAYSAAFLAAAPMAAYGQIRYRSGSETPPQAAAAAARRRKRHRTKFTAEQKEKMQAFAEKLGWRIHKQDDGALQELCVELGIKRHVLKVWIHNNKNHHVSNSSSVSKRDNNAAVAQTPISV